MFILNPISRFWSGFFTPSEVALLPVFNTNGKMERISAYALDPRNFIIRFLDWFRGRSFVQVKLSAADKNARFVNTVEIARIFGTTKGEILNKQKNHQLESWVTEQNTLFNRLRIINRLKEEKILTPEILANKKTQIESSFKAFVNTPHILDEDQIQKLSLSTKQGAKEHVIISTLISLGEQLVKTQNKEGSDEIIEGIKDQDGLQTYSYILTKERRVHILDENTTKIMTAFTTHGYLTPDELLSNRDKITIQLKKLENVEIVVNGNPFLLNPTFIEEFAKKKSLEEKKKLFQTLISFQDQSNLNKNHKVPACNGQTHPCYVVRNENQLQAVFIIDEKMDRVNQELISKKLITEEELVENPNKIRYLKSFADFVDVNNPQSFDVAKKTLSKIELHFRENGGVACYSKTNDIERLSFITNHDKSALLIDAETDKWIQKLKENGVEDEELIRNVKAIEAASKILRLTRQYKIEKFDVSTREKREKVYRTLVSLATNLSAFTGENDLLINHDEKAISYLITKDYNVVFSGAEVGRGTSKTYYDAVFLIDLPNSKKYVWGQITERSVSAKTVPQVPQTPSKKTIINPTFASNTATIAAGTIDAGTTKAKTIEASSVVTGSEHPETVKPFEKETSKNKESPIEAIKKEINLLNKFHSEFNVPHLVPRYDYVVEDGDGITTNKTIVFIQEKFDRIVLSEIAEGASGLNMQDMLIIALHTTEALAAVHKAKYTHCDIKPENVLLVKVDGRVKEAVLTDLGGVAEVGKTMHAGTPEYMPNEACVTTSKVVLGAINKQYVVNPSLDCFSLGVTLLEILTGKSVMEYLPKKEGKIEFVTNRSTEEVKQHKHKRSKSFYELKQNDKFNTDPRIDNTDAVDKAKSDKAKGEKAKTDKVEADKPKTDIPEVDKIDTEHENDQYYISMYLEELTKDYRKDTTLSVEDKKIAQGILSLCKHLIVIKHAARYPSKMAFQALVRLQKSLDPSVKKESYETKVNNRAKEDERLRLLSLGM